jgi:hypothetical protein
MYKGSLEDVYKKSRNEILRRKVELDLQFEIEKFQNNKNTIKSLGSLV